MQGTSSAPTARVLDVVELLVRAGDTRLRFVDVSRELGINQATAHSILKTLCDKGWATRDPVDKGFSVGPALAMIAARIRLTRPLANAARVVAAEMSDKFGYPASVIERAGDSLVITAFEGGQVPHPAGITGDRIPFVPPFGVAFAAWDSVEEQRAWVQRAPAADATVEERLYRVLARTRERGFDVDWTTPALAEAAQVVDTLNSYGLPKHVRHTLEKLRNEFTTIGLLSDDDPGQSTQPVATISVPVIDQHNRVALMVGVHPMRALTTRQVNMIGSRLVKASAALSQNYGHARDHARQGEQRV
jgi:DNA-binding IclR family transcriptional regulator